MKIAIAYPPFTKKKLFPNLPQNRQFIYTASNEVGPYPVVMATAATWLKNLGHKVLWLDGITRRLDFKKFKHTLSLFNPDLIVLESKAPIMKKLWRFINAQKKQSLKGSELKTVLVGDHVSFFPKESFEKSTVDYVLTGGDWDFLLANLAEHLEKGVKLEKGIWQRNLKFKMQNEKLKLKIKNSGKDKLNRDLGKTPIIDRQLTRWQDYGEAYLFKPCAYVMFGRGCGIEKNGSKTGACSFCIWQHALWRCSARLRPPEQVVEEIKGLVDLRVKEIFDDSESGALWDYQWLKKLYFLLKKRGILGRVVFSSNARGDQLDQKTCRLLRRLNYRLLKVGLESGSNKILKKINKKETVKQIVKGVKNAKDAGLRVMLTIMTGYPWEKEKDFEKTYTTARKLMLYKTRAGDCLQASVITPYPGTPLWREAKTAGLLAVEPFDYEKYDMSNQSLKTKIKNPFWRCAKIWSIHKDPRFIFSSLISIRSFDEVKLLLKGLKSLLGHLKDYGSK